jgi:hypothetical protein
MANDQFKSALEKHTLHVKSAYIVEKITISQNGMWGEHTEWEKAIVTLRKHL